MDKTDKISVELATIDTSTVQNLIYTVRGKQIMLDSDLAMLYGVETKRLNESMKRNKKRFPDNFCFQLTENEFEDLRSQFATSNALMFEKIGAVELSQLEYKIDTDTKFDKIFNYISEHEESAQKLYFNGQIYDAFSLLVSLIARAKKSIILIDGYIDTGTLDLLSKKAANIPVTIYTFMRGNKLTISEIQKFNTQYPIVDIKIDESFHDRFLILDNSICYHIGASLKDAGKKSFALSLIADPKMVTDILNRL